MPSPKIIPLAIGHDRTCECRPNHLNCLTAKEWAKCQLGVWRFYYEKRDVRNKKVHPAAFPIALAQRCIELFTHRGELVLDPFAGSGTTLVAARDLGRNAVGFDLNPAYVTLCQERLATDQTPADSQQIPVQDDARRAARYLPAESVRLILTSPPYANLLGRPRRNKSRRSDLRENDQFLKIEQYSMDPRDLGTLEIAAFKKAFRDIFVKLRTRLAPQGHCVINVPDMWLDNRRITMHLIVIEALTRAGFEFRNTIIWDRTNIVNRIGIFGWPKTYITMGTTFEYLLDFLNPGPAEKK